MIIIDNVAKLFLKREWFQVFPSKLFRLENEDSILQFIDLLRLLWDESFWFLEHSTKNDYVVRVKAEREVISDFLRDFDIKDCPNTELGIVAFN